MPVAGAAAGAGDEEVRAVTLRAPLGHVTFRSAGEYVTDTGLYALLVNVHVPGRRPQTLPLVVYDLADPPIIVASCRVDDGAAILAGLRALVTRDRFLTLAEVRSAKEAA